MSCQECPTTDVYFGNDAKLTLDDIAVNDVNLDAATVTYQIYDSDDLAVLGASGSVIAVGTGGDYSTVIDKAIIALLSDGQEYNVRINGVEAGTEFEFNVPILVKRRGKT